MDVLLSLLSAFELILQPGVLLYVLLGVVMGIALGILPGLGGIAGMSILIVVLTQFQAEPLAGIAIAIGMIAVIPTSDTFASVLLGIPGSSASQATVLDGFPLAKQGKAAQALSSAFVSSLFGGILGVIVLTIILAFAASIITYIRTPAQFMLAVFGIALVGILSGRSLLKGFLAAGLGLFVGMIGSGSLDGFVRFTGKEYAWIEGISDWTAQFFPHSLSTKNPKGFIEEWQKYLRSG
ncbi:MAG: tripartite tricarboxylate transporter permease, partial [Alphaproteobacteria bacterium]